MSTRGVPSTSMKNLSNGPALVLAVTIIIALASPRASAWSNGGYSADLDDPDYGTHDWVADMALSIQTEDVSYLMTTYHTEYLIGTEAPDNPDFIGDSIKHHVYYYSSGVLQDDASAVRASAMYDLALESLGSGDFSAAAYYIGAMTHYIADVGVFGHTMGAYTDWGAEEHHADYEGEFETRLPSISLPSDVILEDSDAHRATLALARDITFGKGDIRTNTWMDANYDWSDDVFLDSALGSLYEAVSAAAAAINHLMVATDIQSPEPTDPASPATLEAYVDEGDVVLTWTPPSSDGGSPIVEYLIYKGTNATDGVMVATASSFAQSWTDTDVESGETYTYWVAARNSVGSSELSTAVTVTLPPPELGPSLLLTAVVSAIAATLASGGAFYWRRRSRGPGKR